MNSFLKSCTALTVALTFSGQAIAQVKELGKGEGEVNIVAWPGYIERGETDKGYDWVTDFEKETGCKVNVKTADTSDEMVALMNEGGFDLVTASGDASLRLVAGKRVQPINTDLIPSWKTVDDRLQGRALVHGRRRALRRALSVGPERADVQHRRVQGSAQELERRLRGDERCPTASRTRAASRPMTAPIYIADAANLSDGAQAGARHQGPLRAERGPVQGGARSAARPAHAGRPLLARRHHPGRRLQERRRRRLRLVAVSRSTCCSRRQAAGRLDRSRRKARPAGPTPP